MSEERARELIERIEDLPTLPEVVIEITRLVESPDASADDVYRIVSLDVSLSATMLKLVNSAFYGMGRSVTSLEKAIRILGFATVRNIALAAFVFDAFLTGRGQFDYRSFWLHSIGSAAAANVLGRRLRVPEVGEYFVHGLLHNLGVVIFMQYLPEEFAGVRRLATEGRDVIEAEAEVAGCTRGELGGVLAERWEFPAALAASIRCHRAPLPREYARETAVAICAGALASAMEIGTCVETRVPPVPPAIWQAARVAPEQMGVIIDEVALEMEHSRSFTELLKG